MIAPKDDWMRGTKEIMFPSIKSANDGKKFSIVDFVVAFSRIKGLGYITDRFENTFGVMLTKDSSSGDFGSIGFKKEGIVGVWH